MAKIVQLIKYTFKHNFKITFGFYKIKTYFPMFVLRGKRRSERVCVGAGALPPRAIKVQS